MSGITINYVEKPVAIDVDLTLLTWGDLLKIQRAMGGGVDDQQAEELLNGVLSRVTGQDATTLPALAVSEILRSIMSRVSGRQTEKN